MLREIFYSHKMVAWLLCLPLLATIMPATTTASEWKKTAECAISSEISGFYRHPPKCWSLTRKGSSRIYAENHVFESTDYWTLTILRLAGPFTVWAKSDPETIFKGAGQWLDEQEAKMTPAPEKTVPITLWVNRAKSWNLTTKDYGAGCYAFASTGGSSNTGNRQSYQFAAIVCAKNGQSIPVETRGEIAASFKVTHEFYKQPFRSE